MVLAALSPHPTPHNPVIPGNPRETGRPWVAMSCMGCLFPVGGCQSLGIGLRVAADALTGEACEAQVAGSAKALSKPGLVALLGGCTSGEAAFLALFLTFPRSSQRGSTSVGMAVDGLPAGLGRRRHIGGIWHCGLACSWQEAPGGGGGVGSLRESVPCASGCQRHSA